VRAARRSRCEVPVGTLANLPIAAAATEAELTQLFRGAQRLCILTGAVSGNLELLDFHCQGLAYEAWCRAVAETAPGLLNRLVVERSPSAAWHVVYRCSVAVDANTKLAQKVVFVDGPDEVTLYGRQYKPRQDARGRWHAVTTTIETRGERGLFLCAPSPGYQLLQGDLAAPPTITPEERETLLAAARSHNECWSATPEQAKADHRGDLRPRDDFNRRGDVRAMPQRHGWVYVRLGSDGNELWRSPGKAEAYPQTGCKPSRGGAESEYLEEAFELSPEKAEYVLPEEYRRRAMGPGGWANANLRTTLAKIIRRAGLDPWPRLWHSLRASCETDLVGAFPLAVVTKWLGNTPSIALRHYVDVTDADFERAAAWVPEGVEKATQNPTQQKTATAGSVQKAITQPREACPTSPYISPHSRIMHPPIVEDRGLEPLTFWLPARRSPN
jgi:hypothetical protein